MQEPTIIVPVYNEENRIDDFLNNLHFASKIILLNKNSTDSTVQKANKHKNVSIVNVPYGPPSSEHYHLDKVLENVKSDWLLILVASQRIDRSLYDHICKIVCKTKKDILSLPFKNYTLGFCTTYNPWPAETSKPLCCRKSVANFQPVVHRELCFKSDKMEILDKKFGSVHHVSNSNLDALLRKSQMYARQEVEEYLSKDQVHPITKRPLYFIFKAIINGYFRRNFTLFRGPTGVLLGTAYVVTQLLILLHALQIDKKQKDD